MLRQNLNPVVLSSSSLTQVASSPQMQMHASKLTPMRASTQSSIARAAPRRSARGC